MAGEAPSLSSALHAEGAFWINLVERWFAVLTEKQLRRGVHRSTRDLEAAIDQFLTVYHEAPKPFVWTKTADEILASVAALVIESRTQDTSCWAKSSL